MKSLITFYVACFTFLFQSAYPQHTSVFVGDIHGVTLDSFQKTEVIPYRNFRLPPISASKHRIEIRLFEVDLPMGSLLCTILTYDTAFRRKVFRIRFYDDSLEKPNEIAVPQNNLDGIFTKMVASGIFTVGSSYRDDIKRDYRPMLLGPSGLDSTGGIQVDDGVNYFLEYKVDRYYDQECFDNPEAYSEYYKDNQMLRRQKEIVTAIKDGIFK